MLNITTKENKMKDAVTTRIERTTYKKLQQLKLDLDIKTISGVVTFLVEKQIKDKK
jgi:hypothetical protein